MVISTRSISSLPSIVTKEKASKRTWIDPVGVGRCYRSKDCNALDNNISALRHNMLLPSGDLKQQEEEEQEDQTTAFVHARGRDIAVGDLWYRTGGRIITCCRQDGHSMLGSSQALDQISGWCQSARSQSCRAGCILASSCGIAATTEHLGRRWCHCPLIIHKKERPIQGFKSRYRET